MNQVFIDNALIITSLLSAIAITRFSKSRKTSALFSVFLLFPPLLVFLNMWAHTVAVSIVNIKRYNAGTFHYGFTLYALLLFGIVFIVLSGVNIHYARKRIAGDTGKKKIILLLNALTILFFLPVAFINPVGFLPVIASIMSSITLCVSRPFKSRIVYKAGAAREASF